MSNSRELRVDPYRNTPSHELRAEEVVSSPISFSLKRIEEVLNDAERAVHSLRDKIDPIQSRKPEANVKVENKSEAVQGTSILIEQHGQIIDRIKSLTNLINVLREGSEV